MAAPVLAQYLGGGPDYFLGNFMLAFVSAVAFATIVASSPASCSPRHRLWLMTCTWVYGEPERPLPRRDRSRRRASLHSLSVRWRSVSASPQKGRTPRYW